MTIEKTKPAIGLCILTALVAGNMIGSGVFLLPSALAHFGSIGIIGWALTAVGAIFLALVFAQLSIWIPKVGGPYAYCREGFGDFLGFEIAYNYWIGLWVGNAAIVVAFIGYLSVFFPTLIDHRMLSYIISVATIWLLTIINIIGVREAGILQLITTILKVLPLLIIATVGLFFVHPHNLAEFNISGHTDFSALSAAAMLTLWSFIGLESATVPAGAVNNPIWTIPRATIIGVCITAIIYILSTVAVMGVISPTILRLSTAPYADAARVMFGSWGGWLVAVGALISCFGALNGWILLQGQVPYAAARDQLFPKAFTKEAKSGTPVVGLVVSSALVSILLLLTLNQGLVEQFTLIILLATLASLIPYFFTAMAELMLLIRLRQQFNRRRFIVTSIIAIIASIYAFWAIASAGLHIVYYGMLLFLSGVPVYVWMRWQRSCSDDE